MISDTNAPEIKEGTAEQEARLKLRQIFLQALNELNGQPCSILTYEQNRLSANFSGLNNNGKDVLVRDLTTPIGVNMPAALLRTSDIIAVEFHSDIQLP